MIRKTLRNGMKVILSEREGNVFAIQINVNAGSNNENPSNYGISHFIEHMLFEGTCHRTALEIATAIEGIGSEIGAYTANERTCFYIKGLCKHFPIAAEVLADIVRNPLFDEKSLEKERKIILNEIRMNFDEPRLYQWELFEKTLFTVHPARIPVIGTVESIKRIGKEDVIKFYNDFYVPSNMTVTIIGNVTNALATIQEMFEDMPSKPLARVDMPVEPKQENIRKSKKRKHVNQSYFVLGYLAPARGDSNSYIFDVLRAIYGKGLSGRMFNEIRTKRGLAYDVGAHYADHVTYGFFAIYISTHTSNIEKSVRIILDEFRKLDNLDEKELQEAKNFLEGEFIMDCEDVQKEADLLAFWENVGDVHLSKEYTKRIAAVTKQDLLRVRDEYLGPNYSLAVIEQMPIE